MNTVKDFVSKINIYNLLGVITYVIILFISLTLSNHYEEKLPSDVTFEEITTKSRNLNGDIIIDTEYKNENKLYEKYNDLRRLFFAMPIAISIFLFFFHTYFMGITKYNAKSIDKKILKIILSVFKEKKKYDDFIKAFLISFVLSFVIMILVGLLNNFYN